MFTGSYAFIQVSKCRPATEDFGAQKNLGFHESFIAFNDSPREIFDMTQNIALGCFRAREDESCNLLFHVVDAMPSVWIAEEDLSWWLAKNHKCVCVGWLNTIHLVELAMSAYCGSVTA